MGRLEALDQSSSVAIGARVVVGRAPSSDWCLPHPEVSSTHAEIRWRVGGWEIKDLGSRNGTWVGGRRLEAGQWVSLMEGGVVAFGAAQHSFRLVSADPPAARAVPVAGGETVDAVDGVLLLPDDEYPEIAIVQQLDGSWAIDGDEGPVAVAHDHELAVGDVRYRLVLPEGIPATAAATEGASLHQLALRFQVSADEEYVHLFAVHQASTVDLGARVHHYPLFVLARLRLRDRAEPDVADSAEGWVYQDELEQMLSMSRSQLNMAVFRARRQLAKAGVGDASGLVERRAVTRQLRLGIRDLHIESV